MVPIFSKDSGYNTGISNLGFKPCFEVYLLFNRTEKKNGFLLTNIGTGPDISS